MIKEVTTDLRRNPESLWFEHLSRSAVPSLRVFCFPYAGGSADVYRSWKRWFPERVDICLGHLPGRGRRIGERAFTSLPPLVKAIADRIEPKLKIPYILYGHSMGALLSFELARELHLRRQPAPRKLLVSGRRAPQWPKAELPISNFPEDEFIGKLKKLNGTPQEVFENPELMHLFLDVLKADFGMVENYEYSHREPLSCPIMVYSGLEDEEIPIESCRAWRDQTSATCRVKVFKGGHFFIRNPDSEFINAFRGDVLDTVPRTSRAGP